METGPLCANVFPSSHVDSVSLHRKFCHFYQRKLRKEMKKDFLLLSRRWKGTGSEFWLSEVGDLSPVRIPAAAGIHPGEHGSHGAG